MNHDMNQEEMQEYIDMLKEAQTKLYDALYTLDYVQRCTDNNWAKHYIIAPITIATSNEHEWVSHDPNIDKWIKQLEEEMAELPSEDEEYEEDENV